MKLEIRGDNEAVNDGQTSGGALSAETIPFELRLYSKQQVADYFSVEVRTIELWMKKRKLPYIKIGGTVRFKMRDVLQYLDDHCRVAAKATTR